MTRLTKIGLIVTLAAAILVGTTALALQLLPSGSLRLAHLSSGAGVLGLPLASAHGGRPAIMKRVMSAMIDDALEAAQVTTEQRAAIHGVRDRVFAAVEQLRQNRSARMEEVLAAFEADTIDMTQLAAMRAQREEQHRQIADVITQAVIDTHAVLTPAQRKALADYVRAHHQRRNWGG
jgi:protein CpxP